MNWPNMKPTSGKSATYLFCRGASFILRKSESAITHQRKNTCKFLSWILFKVQLTFQMKAVGLKFNHIFDFWFGSTVSGPVRCDKNKQKSNFGPEVEKNRKKVFVFILVCFPVLFCSFFFIPLLLQISPLITEVENIFDDP